MVLYSQPACPQCRMVHMLLDKKKIKYEECQDINVMQTKGIQHTPTLEVDGKLLAGKEMMSYINSL